MQHLTLAIDADGIATITIDVAGRSMNVIHPALERELEAALDQAVANAAVKGLLITSAKTSFIPGYDLTELVKQFSYGYDAVTSFTRNGALGALYRKLETCGKPVAVAINGLAMGGGLELCLACHYRVLVDDPKALLSLPEVKVGLLPGAGGTQRLPRLIGLEASLPLLLEGKNVVPSEALKLGIVHEVVPAADLIATARRWLLGSPTAQQPWDRKGFRIPGASDIANGKTGALFAATAAQVARQTLGNYPAPRAILSCLFEGANMPIDTALKIEGKYFAQLVTGSVARNLIRTTFINKGAADKLSRRPAGAPKMPVKKVGILGAGMMGAGIAYVAAAAGIECVLVDTERHLADKGKSYAADQLRKELSKGRGSQSRVDAVLARISPTTDLLALKDCDLIVEAVFENRAIKSDMIRRVEEVIPHDAIFASNTSTLPISSLAEASRRPEQFIGIHFFSPVERMPLVEIIRGARTSDMALAKALDFVGQLRKTPIVVNDGRGFYTSRVFGSFCYEGQRMLEEGVEPALIENAARAAGMPVGPLAVTDEVSLSLQYNVIRQTKEDLGASYLEPISWPVLRRFVEDLKRGGRKAGGGFYDYPEGGKKQLWSGLRDLYPVKAQQPSLDEVKSRLLYVQALEAVHCLEEGVLVDVAEGDIGSVFGWGFPSYTGGTFSFVDTVGLDAFVTECRRLEELHGPRFAPTAGLLARAASGATFHPAAAAS